MNRGHDASELRQGPRGEHSNWERGTLEWRFKRLFQCGVIRPNGGDKIDKVWQCGDFGNTKKQQFIQLLRNLNRLPLLSRRTFDAINSISVVNVVDKEPLRCSLIS